MYLYQLDNLVNLSKYMYVVPPVSFLNFDESLHCETSYQPNHIVE